MNELIEPFMTDSMRAVSDICATITKKVDRAYVAECGIKGEIPEKLWRMWADTGLLGMGIPEEYGGSGGGVSEIVLANDLLYQYEAGGDYNPAPGLESIQAALLAINSADDERNPDELGIMAREIQRVKRGRYVLIPASKETRGHGTTSAAKFWERHLVEFLRPDVQSAR